MYKMSDYMRVRLQYAGVSKTSNGEDTWCPSVIVAQKYTTTTSFVLRTGARNFLRLKKTANSFSYSRGCKLSRKVLELLWSQNCPHLRLKIGLLKKTYATGLRTERKHRPSFVSSRVKHMHGRGIASSRRAMVLNLHLLRWSAMLAMLANFHSFTVPKAVLNLHT